MGGEVYLKNHKVLSSSNLDDMREILSRLTNTEGLDLIGKRQEIDGAVYSASFSGLCLSHAAFGDVRTSLVDGGQGDRSHLLILPTNGHAEIKHQGESFEITPNMALMRDIHTPFEARQDHFSCLSLSLPANVIKKQARSLLGEGFDVSAFTFDTQINLTTAEGQHLRNTLRYVADALDGSLRFSNNTILLEGLKDLLLNSILTFLPNSYSDQLQSQQATRILPYHVKRARDFMHEHADKVIGVTEIAAAAGCGYRTVQHGFMEAFGLSPMAYLRTIRLHHVRKALQNAESSVSIARLAQKWGFTHPGRFAKVYAREFGEMPSETLRRRSM